MLLDTEIELNQHYVHLIFEWNIIRFLLKLDPLRVIS